MAKEKKPETRQGPWGGKTTVTKGGLIRTVIYLDPEERRALNPHLSPQLEQGLPFVV
jgi:hypothetical protein